MPGSCDARKAVEMSVEPTVWVIGDWRQAEFGEAVTWLKTRARCLWFDDGPAALSSLRAAEGMYAPTAILLAQSRPGQITRRDVEELHARAPLARLVALVGAWCDGESRSGQPWAGVVRVPVGTWRCGLEQAIGLDAANGSSRLPRTVTPVERIETMLSTVKRRSRIGATAAVFSNRQVNYEAIADLLQQAGVESVRQIESGENVSTADAVVFDGWENVCTDSYTGNRSPRVLLLPFPREEDFVRARDAGIDAVLQTPVLLSDLAGTLNGIVHHAPGPLACASG